MDQQFLGVDVFPQLSGGQRDLKAKNDFDLANHANPGLTSSHAMGLGNDAANGLPQPSPSLVQLQQQISAASMIPASAGQVTSSMRLGNPSINHNYFPQQNLMLPNQFRFDSLPQLQLYPLTHLHQQHQQHQHQQLQQHQHQQLQQHQHQHQQLQQHQHQQLQQHQHQQLQQHHPHQHQEQPLLYQHQIQYQKERDLVAPIPPLHIQQQIVNEEKLGPYDGAGPANGLVVVRSSNGSVLGTKPAGTDVLNSIAGDVAGASSASNGLIGANKLLRRSCSRCKKDFDQPLIIPHITDKDRGVSKPLADPKVFKLCQHCRDLQRLRSRRWQKKTKDRTGACRRCGSIIPSEEQKFVLCPDCRKNLRVRKASRAALGKCVHCSGPLDESIITGDDKSKEKHKTGSFKVCQRCRENDRIRRTNLEKLGNCNRCAKALDAQDVGKHKVCASCRTMKKKVHSPPEMKAVAMPDGSGMGQQLLVGNSAILAGDMSSFNHYASQQPQAPGLAQAPSQPNAHFNQYPHSLSHQQFHNAMAQQQQTQQNLFQQSQGQGNAEMQNSMNSNI